MTLRRQIRCALFQKVDWVIRPCRVHIKTISIRSLVGRVARRPDRISSTLGKNARYAPIGPLRIEVGIPINPRVGDDKQAVMFSFGGPP